jgi:hypothetical protein
MALSCAVSHDAHLRIFENVCLVTLRKWGAFLQILGPFRFRLAFSFRQNEQGQPCEHPSQNQRGTPTAADMGMLGTGLTQTLFSKTQAADSRKTPLSRYLNIFLLTSHGILFALLRMNIDRILRAR